MRRSTKLIPTIILVATLGLSACTQKVASVAVEGQTYIAGVGAKLVSYSTDLRVIRTCPVDKGTVALAIRETYRQEFGHDAISTTQVAHDGLSCSGIVPYDFIEGDPEKLGWEKIEDPTASYKAIDKICKDEHMRGLNLEANWACSRWGFTK